MDCNETRQLLGAHLDEELDVAHDAALATHLENCPACAGQALALMEQQRLLQEKATRHRATADLSLQIRAALPSSARPRPIAMAPWKQVTALAACLTLGLFLGFAFGRHGEKTESLLRELTTAHVRARVTGHAIDVASSDRHTVKPWFIGKVDFAPTVPDFSAEGFPLVGGRLERLDGRSAAALVYARRQHSIDVTIWAGASTPFNGSLMRDGYAVTGWRSGDLNFAAVTDASPEELGKFIQLFRAAGKP